MHRGVRELIQWVDANEATSRVELNPPATSVELNALEQQLGGPLPDDFRFVLTRFNGGRLPSGKMLPAGIEPGTVGAAIRKYAEEVSRDFLDSELLLPFHETKEESLLAFDRSAGPVSDTWPIVDYHGAGGEHVVYRTFDGWCRHQVANWEAEPDESAFTLEMYLARGQRHVAAEPDVASAHATVAHAWKRSGRPDHALAAYLRAGRCVPPLPWCDWAALKLAVLLEREEDAFEAAGRLASLAPEDHWARRETTPAKVAEVAAQIAPQSKDPSGWARVFDTLAHQAGTDRSIVETIRLAMVDRETQMPLPRPTTQTVPAADVETRWKQLQDDYEAGDVTDEALVLNPELVRLGRVRPLASLLQIRRDF